VVFVSHLDVRVQFLRGFGESYFVFRHWLGAVGLSHTSS
jgi:hypothetical protein